MIYIWMTICIYHSNDPYITIKSRSEMPLMQPREIWLCRIGIPCMVQNKERYEITLVLVYFFIFGDKKSIVRKYIWHIKWKWNKKKNHLSKTCKTKIFSDVIVGKVAKSNHPNICSNKDTDHIIYLSCSKVMIHQK